MSRILTSTKRLARDYRTERVLSEAARRKRSKLILLRIRSGGSRSRRLPLKVPMRS